MLDLLAISEYLGQKNIPALSIIHWWLIVKQYFATREEGIITAFAYYIPMRYNTDTNILQALIKLLL